MADNIMATMDGPGGGTVGSVSAVKRRRSLDDIVQYSCYGFKQVWGKYELETVFFNQNLFSKH